MAIGLALLEGAWILAAVSGTLLAWARPLFVSWRDVATVSGEAALLSLCCIMALCSSGLYDLRFTPSFGHFVSRLPRALGLTLLLLAALYPVWPGHATQRGSFVLGVLISVLMMIALLPPLRAIAYRVMRSRHFITRVLILGTSPLAHKLIQEIEARPHVRYAIVGVVDDTGESELATLAYPVMGPLERVDKIIEEVRPDRILVALADRRGQLPARQLLESGVCQGIIVEEGADAYERLTGKLAIESLAASRVIFSRNFRPSPLKIAVGRMSSLLVAAVALVLLSPVMGLIALAIRLDSPGPIFFRQVRVTLRGRCFILIKFRTMRPVDHAPSEWECDNVDRITRIGKWLRAFWLDELPQLVNILRGDMNLVGPRPHPVSNFQLFVEKIPYYSLRSLVRPGLTGWAQVRNGYANNLEEETEKVRYDLYYIKHVSFGLDLRILFETAKILLSGREAATNARRHVSGRGTAQWPERDRKNAAYDEVA